MINGKKAQLYLVVAVIICVTLIGVYSTAINLKYDTKNIQLDDLCHNYKSESNKLINTLILNKEDVLGNYRNFVKEYHDYGKTINYNFGIVYILTYENTTLIENFINEEICMDLDGKNICLSAYPNTNTFAFEKKSNTVSFMYNKEWFNYTTYDNVKLNSLCLYKRNNNDITIIE